MIVAFKKYFFLTSATGVKYLIKFCIRGEGYIELSDIIHRINIVFFGRLGYFFVFAILYLFPVLYIS